MVTWAYIAGFTDGEGSIDISPRRWKPRVRIHLYQKNPEVLRRIHKATGLGRLVCVRRKDQKDPNYTTWVLCIERKLEMMEFMEKIHKHSIVKRERIEEAMEALSG